MALYNRPGLLEFTNDSTDKAEVEYMNEPSFKVKVIPHPELVALFDNYGFTRRGRNTWSISSREENVNNFVNFLVQYANNFTPGTLHVVENDGTSESVFDSRKINHHPQPNAFTSSYFYGMNSNAVVHSSLRVLTGANHLQHLPNRIKEQTTKQAYAEALDNSTALFQPWNGNYDRETNKVLRDNGSPFILAMKESRDVLYIRLKMVNPRAVYRNPALELIEHSFGLVDHIPLGVTTPVSSQLNIVEAMNIINGFDKLFSRNIFTEESQTFIDVISEKIDGKLFANSIPGHPNEVQLLNPSAEKIALKLMRKTNTKVKGATKNGSIPKFGKIKMPISEVLEVEKKNDNIDLSIHPSLIDVQNMMNSKEYTDENRLYGYQRRAVGLQLSTSKGILNSLDTGIGKSVVQLTAMRERSKSIPNYRGLIVCQSNTKNQWKEYMIEDNWFPEAEVVIVKSGNDVDSLSEALSKEGPVVVIATFNMASLVSDVLEMRNAFQEELKTKTRKEAAELIADFQKEEATRELNIGDLLVDAYWNDICADEATSIRNSTSSKQARALWHLRNNSEMGSALTATPFNKNIDDIARLLEWVRNERHMFYGNKLSNRFDQENITEENAVEIFNSLYPMVFRFTKEEAAAEEKDAIKIPEELEPETVLLKPSAAELALSNACEYELKRIISELETALDNYEAQTDAEKKEVEEAREALNAAHGHWMAGTNIARMATSNPASILKSKSLAAQLLIGQGLVSAAMQDVPTKQRYLLESIPTKVAEGKQILVFTDFVEVANSLQEALESIGVRTGVYGGSNLKKRDENRIKFQNSELDVLVCTKAAERGLTLHKASVVYHYDMSWTLEPLLQKSGRAARVGSENEQVETFFLILEKTIEEKVAENVLTQGMLSSMVLDNARGVQIKNTTTGKLMGGLTKASSNINSRKGALEFGKALLGV